MNYDVYYEKRQDGSYILHFPNDSGLNTKQIETMFSRYGNVVSVNNRGQAKGLCFVRYNTLEEVKRCVDGFHGSKEIRILPHKRKLNASQTNAKANAQKKDQTKKRTLSNKSPQSNVQTEAKCDRQKEGNLSSEDGEKKGNDNQTETNMLKQMLKASNNKLHESGKDHTSGRSSQHLTENSIIGNNHFQDDLIPNIASSLRLGVISKLDRLKKLQHATSSSFGSLMSSDNAIAQHDKMHEERIPALISTDENIQDNCRFSLPVYSLPSKYEVLPAQEVIVANIHVNYGIHYILHLFEKYDPICASLIKIIPKTAIRYCHVYFKTQKEALETEKEFDNFVLFGHKLIVLTQTRLWRENFLL